MKERLSTVYLDDYPVTLMGDEAAPPLSRIIRAGGKRPDYVDVVLLASPSDRQGRPVGLDEIIDRAAEPTRPIYLRTVPHDVKPIYTVGPDRVLPGRERRREPGPPSPNADPVISQLGRQPVRDRTARDPPPHEEGVFRAPSQLPPDPVKGSGGEKHKRVGSVGAQRRAEAQAHAEAEAEQRQEDDRNLEDALQDEAEAYREAEGDGNPQ